MSVIIRLQNLPWSANALDIRQYFHGLSIPEGGVHIVGGEQGDAFIAFSTDEDARQAMGMDGGRLKEIRIRLLLSSRAEMQKVIEQARQQTISLQQTLANPTNLMNLANQQHIPQQDTPPQIPLPPVHIPVQQPVQQQMSYDRRNSAEVKRDDRENRRSRKSSRDRSRDRSRSREKDRRRDRNRDSDSDRRDRDPDRRSNRRRTRSRERSRRRDRSRSQERRRAEKTPEVIVIEDEVKKPPQLPQPVPLLSNGMMGNNAAAAAAALAFPAAQQLLNSWPNMGFQNPASTPPQLPTESALVPTPFLPHMAPFVANMSSARAFNAEKLEAGQSHDAWGSVNNDHDVRQNIDNRRTDIYDNRRSDTFDNRRTDNFENRQEVNFEVRRSADNAMDSRQVNSFDNPRSNYDNRRNDSFENRGEIDFDNRHGNENFDRRGNDNKDNRRGMNFDNRPGNDNFDNRNSNDGFHNRRGNANFANNRRSNDNPDNRRNENFDNRRIPDNSDNRRSSENIDNRRSMDISDNRRSDNFNNRRNDNFNNRNLDPRHPGDTTIRPNERPRRSAENDIQRYNRNEDRLIRDARFNEERNNRFRNPDDHYKRHDRQIPPGNCVEVRKVPNHFKFREIRSLFPGLFISSNGIKIINDTTGRRTGIAYIRFVHREGKDKALQKNGEEQEDYIYDLVSVTDEVFDGAVDSFSPHRHRKEENVPETTDPWLSLKNLPPTCTEDAVRDFFIDFPIEQVLLQTDRDGNRATGLGFVKLTTLEQAQRAVTSLNNGPLGNKPVSVSLCSSNDITAGLVPTPDAPSRPSETQNSEPEAVNQPELKNRQPEPKTRHSEFPIHQPEAPSRPPLPIIQPLMDPQKEILLQSLIDTDCIFMNGLPLGATDRDILDFFSDIGLVPARFHLMLDGSGNPYGDAYCEFANKIEVERALCKDGTHLGKNIVHVKAVYRQEMLNKLGVLPQQPQMPLNRPLMPPMMRGPRPMMRPDMRPMRPPLLQGPPRPYMRQFRPDMRMNMRPRGPRPPFRNSHEPDSSPMLEEFGDVGCVVSLANVPFMAGVDDIAEFFSGYGVPRDKVIRRYDDMGRITGDARVAFKSQEDANRAIDEFNQQLIMGRRISMEIV